MKRSGPLRARSKAQRAHERRMRGLKVELLERSGGYCEVRASEICTGVAVHPHHRLRRSQGGGDVLSNLLHVCANCHSTIHMNPALSYERGWLLRREAV